MAQITHITNYSALAIDRLFHQFKNASRLEALLNTFVAGSQDVEDEGYKLFTERSLNSAVGTQLDNIGAIVGATRVTGQSDTDFRQVILAFIARNTSKGRISDINGIVNLLYPNSTSTLFELFPASFNLEIENATALPNIDLTEQVINIAKPVGVDFGSIVSVPSNFFGFAESTGSDNGGFANDNVSDSGGEFSSQL